MDAPYAPDAADALCFLEYIFDAEAYCGVKRSFSHFSKRHSSLLVNSIVKTF
jgi:hypothetical protein